MSDIPKRSHPLITPVHLAGTAIVMIRQSSLSQVRNNDGSAALQRAQTQIAHEYGFAKVLEIDADMAKSASTTTGRVGWEQMIVGLTTGMVRAVFAWSISRLSRAVRDFAPMLALCRFHKALLIIDGQVLDPSNPHDTLMAHIHSAAAEMDNTQRANLMRKSRLKKAAGGAVVSQLPLGWVKLPDGSWDFDPEVSADIRALPGLFWQHGSLRQTARAMNAQGMTIPTRYAGSVRRQRVTVDRLRAILLGESYVGDYVFGKTEMGVDLDKQPDGRPVQIPVPPDRWIRHENLYPAYFTREGQERIRAQVEANGFERRHRPGRGRSLCQGLVACGRCGNLLTVCDPQRRPSATRYQCTSRAGRFGEDSCGSFLGEPLDRAIERLILNALSAPPREALEAALQEARRYDDAQANQLRAAHERLVYEEERARERLLRTDERQPHVFAFLKSKLEEASEARESFERRQSATPVAHATDVSGEELARLLVLASDIPILWRHPSITNLDRKRILLALIERIVLVRRAEAVEATVCWHSGVQTVLNLQTRAGVRSLVCALNAEGLTVEQICQRLREEDPDTGARWKYTLSAVYQILRRFDLHPNSPPARPSVDQAVIQNLYDQGLTLTGIADKLNASRVASPSGKSWNMNMVWHWLGTTGRREQLEHLHRAAIVDAKARGLSNEEAAVEFNRDGLPRVGGRQWTGDVVRQRRTQLKRRKRRSAPEM